jgi:hypothetical protein
MPLGFLEIIQTLSVLDLSNNSYGCSGVLHQFPHFKDICCFSGKGGGNKIYFILQPKAISEISLSSLEQGAEH